MKWYTVLLAECYDYAGYEFPTMYHVQATSSTEAENKARAMHPQSIIKSELDCIALFPGKLDDWKGDMEVRNA